MRRTLLVPEEIRNTLHYNGFNRDAMVVFVNQKYLPQKFREPDVSIIIPAYNEADFIVRTVLSLCLNTTNLNFEIIVIDNNSNDETEKLVRSMGLRYMFESVQGVTAARNAGLGATRGRYVLSADADTVYPSRWIDAMVGPLITESEVAATYGTFGFLPGKTVHRAGYFLYEHCADISRWAVKKFGDEAANIYGFNFAFRREQALAVDWFNHPRDAKEDGWLALKLRDKGFGELQMVREREARVWTSDRKIQDEGGMIVAFRRRVTELISGKKF